MEHESLLNIILFNPPAGKQTYGFYKQMQEGYCAIHKNDLIGERRFAGF